MASRCFCSRSAARRHERGAASGRSSTRCRSRNGGPGDARHPRASISRDALVPAASASPGAPQPTRSASRGASQPADHTCIFRVVSFNFSYHQSMMTGNRRSVQNHCHTFARLAVRLVTESKADLLLACEVGGYRQGLRQAGIDSADVLSRYFGRRIVCSEIDIPVGSFEVSVARCSQNDAFNVHGRGAHPISLRALAHASLVRMIFFLKNLSKASEISLGGPPSMPPMCGSKSANGGAGICNVGAARSRFGRFWRFQVASMSNSSEAHSTASQTAGNM